VTILAVSGYRSPEDQTRIIERRLKSESIEKILTSNTPPGYSEHHTGRALDVGDPSEAEFITKNFQHTPAYRWLTTIDPSTGKTNAERFQFRFSYPENSGSHIVFEPWHIYYYGK
jgi:zinc D-Ala-D-Ala carboxypeptidase